MKDKEILDLYEAYHKIYESQKLSEEVEIAAQYFYNLGLNEDGVDIVIEELGIEEFGEFVYELAEEYCLTEATETRLQAKGSLKGPKGSKPQSTTKARVKVQGGTKMSVSGSSSSTIKKDRPKKEKVAAAVEKAKESQPKKRPVLDAIARQVNKGMERHKAAVGAARETGKTIGKAAKHIGGVAREVGKGVSGTAKLAAHVARKGLKDEFIMGYLIGEGYAETEESAYAILENMSGEWRQTILEREMDEPSERGSKPDVKAHNKSVKYRPIPRRPRIEDNPRYGTPMDRSGKFKH